TMRLDFSGKRAIVTGGSNGIGLAAARALTAGGASVAIFDLEPPPDAQTQFVRVDVTDEASLANTFAAIEAPDIVIANAGTGSEAELTATSRRTWDRIIAINLSGVFHTVRAAATLMKPRRSGSIVLTASTNSYDGEARLAAYNASKAGVLGILHT